MPSFKSHLIAFVLKHTRKKAFRTADGLHAWIAKSRKVQDHRPGAKIAARVAVSERAVAGCTVYDVQPKSSEAKAHILYLHGGAYCFELTPFHWDLIAELSERLSARVTVPVYPLAPEHDFHAIYGAMTEIHRDTMGRGHAVSIVGDSAGGNMALVLTMMAAENGWPKADRLVLLSPGLDMTMANPETQVYAKRDPWLDIDGGRESVRIYAADLDFSDWRISPLYGDLSALPPTLIFSGTRDLLYPDTVIFAQKARDARTDVDLVVGDRMIHVWPLIDMPEARVARKRIVDFLRG